MNSGKRFESDFKASIPQNIFYYRFRDGTANYAGQRNENTRFQQYNICDCMIYNKPDLWLLELKSHKGKSIPFGCIRKNQFEMLVDAGAFCNAGFIFHFADIGETYYIKAIDVLFYIDAGQRKSFPLEWCAENGIKIEQRRLKVNYRYDVAGLIEKAGRE